MKRVAILGSTGSIGRQTITVVSAHADELELCALGCRKNVDAMLLQAVANGVMTIVSPNLGEVVGYSCYRGENAMERYAAEGDYDVLVVAVVGIAGLLPTLSALRRGKTVCLANKETLVCGGPLVREALTSGGGKLLPIDSEHCAILQCLTGSSPKEVDHIILTASGGALRDMALAKLPEATVRDVLAHPNWNMGNKITVDCATMVNKGYEIVEASYLFDMPIDKIRVLLHRQSVVHSLVCYADNSYVAQMAVPDMRLPIQYALLYPRHTPAVVPPLDLTAVTMSFQSVDAERYPALSLVRDAAMKSAARLVAINAADEVTVEAFLGGHIGYGEIHTILSRTAAKFDGGIRDVEDVLGIDAAARRLAKEGIC